MFYSVILRLFLGKDMPFNLKVENFGKLPDEEIHIGQFTVFAGPNNTGKSTVSKLLYSLFDGMNANHALVHFNNLATPLRNNLGRLKLYRFNKRDDKISDSILSVFNDEIKKMEDLIKSYSIDNFEEIDEQLPEICTSVVSLKQLCKKFKADIQRRSSPEQKGIRRGITKEDIEDLENELDGLYEEIERISAEEFVINGVQNKVYGNLIKNFQVGSLSSLRVRKEDTTKIFINNVEIFEFKNSDVVLFKGEMTDLKQLQDYSRVIYLESPIYWKLKSALENSRRSSRFYSSYSGRKRLTGVPGYFYDLAEALEEKYSGDAAFSELYEKLTSKKIMGGKLTISEIGELNFQESKRSFSLHLTAMGVINLGILALLIERKVIDKGAFLFIDEPEAHLHPSWQVIMAETLFELAKGGVNVVIATHSVDILKWLEVHVKKNPDDEPLVALNKFPINSQEMEGQDFNDKVAAIKRELTEPFANLYTEGL